MKELSKEEKAKRYDELLLKLQKAKVDDNVCDEMYYRVIDDIVPELKESEDERIRKGIIRNLEYLMDRAEGFVKDELKERIVWLEKQGEQKSADKVEPKFKVGDWIIDVQGVSANQIIGYEDDSYYIETSCSKFYLPMKLAEKNYRLWTIQDANDGDVLAFNDGHGNDCIDLIKSVTDKKIEFWFCLTNGNRYEVFDGITPYTNLVSREDATPATKEQREQLEKAMSDAGYAFDFDKKELKKIEHKPVETVKWSAQEEDCICQLASLVKEQWRQAEKVHNSVNIKKMSELMFFLKTLNPNKKSQRIISAEVKEAKNANPAWSEEDENIKEWIMSDINKLLALNRKSFVIADKEIIWLKSIKDRVQPQPKQEWSEEDEYCRHQLIVFCENCMVQDAGAKRCAHWLKSLKARSTWKPSDEQMKVLEHFVRSIGESGYASPYENNTKLLYSLLEDLKKLK